MGTFNVVHIQPFNVLTTQGHWDVARLVYFSLQSLGHLAALQVNVFDPQAMNIIVGYERLAPEAIPKGAAYIPYQLEQLAVGGTPVTPAMRQVLRGAREIWEYSPQNIPLLKNVGLPPVKLLPLGYHEALATIVPQAQEDIDVLFYGLLNDRRMSILNKLSVQCTARGLQYVYGVQRDAWIARSKVVINIHYYPAMVAEQVRVSYLLNNRRCVVSESSHYDPLAECCVTIPYEGLVDACLKLVRDPAERERVTTAGAQRFAQLPMTEFLQKVLA